MTREDLHSLLFEHRDRLQKCMTFRERLAAILYIVEGQDVPEGFIDALKESAFAGEIRMPRNVVVTKDLESLLRVAFVVAETKN